MQFARFMSSPLGRTLRIIAGLALALLGLTFVGGTGGIVLAAVGAVPVIAAAGNFCLFAPVFGGPFFGREFVSDAGKH